MIQQHLETWHPKLPAVVDEIDKILYVDDMYTKTVCTSVGSTKGENAVLSGYINYYLKK